MKYFLLLIFISTSSLATSAFNLTEEELDPATEDILIKRPEKYLRHESMIYDFNTSRGIKDQRRYTGSDKNRLSLTGLVNGSYEHLTGILGADMTYMRRSTRYNQIWWGGQLFHKRAQFKEITQNRTTGTNPNADSQYQRPGSVVDNLTAAGLGVGYRFKLLLDFLPTEDVFESIDVFANYLMLDESFIKKKYMGWGLTTNYSIHKRSSTSFFYGGKLSYNFASVTRESIGTENRNDRSLTLGWLSYGFEIGFFY